MTRIVLICLSVMAMILMLVSNWHEITFGAFNGLGDPTIPYSQQSNELVAANIDLLNNKPLSKEKLEKIRENSRLISAMSPLSHYPFLHTAYAEILETGDLQNLELVLEANRRNSRDRTGLRVIGKYYLRKGDYSSALETYDLLSRLDPDIRSEIIAVINFIYQFDEGASAISDRLSLKPDWAKFVLGDQINALSSDGAGLNNVTLMVESYIGDQVVKGDHGIINTYFLKLIKLSKYDQAYHFWQKLKDNAKADGIVHNSKFEKGMGLPPFNWKLFYGKKAGAEYEGAAGLFVFHNSDNPQWLAQQYFPIRPGQKYNIKVNLYTFNKPDRSEFKWRLICRPSNELWHVVSIGQGQKPALEYIEQLPDLPSSCPFVELQLWAYPGKLTGHTSAVFKSIELNEAGEE